MTGSFVSYLCLASAMLILGTSVVASKIITDTMPIYTASAIRTLLAAIILVLLVRRIGGIPRLSLRLHVVVALQAFAGIVLFNVFLLLGLGMTTAIACGIITSSAPAVIAVMSVALGDHLKRRGWVGITVAVVGILIVNVFGTADASGATRPILGAVLVFLAVVCEALFTLLGKVASPSIRPLQMAALVTSYGFLLLLPFAATDVRAFHVTEIPASGWIAMVYLAVVVTIVAFALWFQGLRHVPTSTAGAFTGLIPVGTIIATATLLDEPVTWVHIAGVAIVMVGIVLVTRAIRPSGVAADPARGMVTPSSSAIAVATRTRDARP